MKEFEKKYFRIFISRANEADMKSKLEINLTSSILSFAENQKMGFLIKKMHEIQMNRIIEYKTELLS